VPGVVAIPEPALAGLAAAGAAAKLLGRRRNCSVGGETARSAAQRPATGMNPMKQRRIASAVALLLGWISAAPLAHAQAPAATAAGEGGANLAIVAKPSTSFVSGHETLSAINDGFVPRNSGDTRHGEYGNWPEKGTQWVQYEWAVGISTKRTAVYWWDDNRGVRLPAACRLKYFNGSEFVAVPNVSGLGVERNQFNVTTFDEVTTTKLRLEIDGREQFSTGILEWRVNDSGKSPDFAPVVKTNGDRVVVLPGATYLDATTRAVKENAPIEFAWKKVSGPGEVRFADASARSTSATFSATGDYELKLTASVGGESSSDTVHVRAIESQLQPRLDPVYTRRWKVKSPLWDQRLKVLITNWLPHCIEELDKPDLKEGGIANFVEAGKKNLGQPAGKHIGAPWADAYTHNTVESMCVALMLDPQGDAEITKAQEAFRAKLDQWIPIILAAQESDGYLQTRFTLGAGKETSPPPRWNARYRGEHEGYVGGYFIEAGIAHYLATDGKDLRLYNAAKKLADCWNDHIGPPPKQQWFDGHEEIEQALVRLGRFVNDVAGTGKGEKYIRLARFLIDCRQKGSEYDQSHAPATRQYAAVGHAVRAEYLYSGMTDIAMESGDVDYQSAVQSIWSNLVNRKYYVIGGVGSGDTSEGFGRDYSLKNASYCESCANCGQLFFQYKMNLAYHDARYADLYEDTIFNAILSDYDIEGTNFTYTNSLDTSEKRYRWHTCPCCVGNFPRVLLAMPTWMYSRGGDALYVNLFVGSTVDVGKVAGTDVRVEQITDYPWNGKVTIAVTPASAAEFAIKIRQPDRGVSTLYTPTPLANGITSIGVNGKPVTATTERGYAVIRRTWSAGDKIELEMPMTVQRVKCDPKVAANVGRVALRYGPLLFNAESVDANVEGVLPPDAPLTPVFDPNLLGGVMTIQGKLADGTPFKAIPNYARNNRGGRSVVWMKDQ
jgi:DUF1680 family protein